MERWGKDGAYSNKRHLIGGLRMCKPGAPRPEFGSREFVLLITLPSRTKNQKSMKRKLARLKRFTVALGVVFLGSVTGYAQSTPTLSLARGNVGITSNEPG